MSETIIKNIHPLNTGYLLSQEPHRFYVDAGGNVLELTVRRFSDLIVEKLYEHGGMIAVGYHDAATEGKISFHDTFILRRDGHIYPLGVKQENQGKVGLDIDMFYMLLNPIEMNGWIPEKRKACHQELKEQGKVLDVPRVFSAAKRHCLQLLTKGNQ